MFFHVTIDGSILLKDSDEFREQDDYWENKRRVNKKMSEKMNAAMVEELGEDPCK